MNRLSQIFLFLAIFFWGNGCGYSFQNSSHSLYDREGVEKIYVSQLTNNTYKAGVENIVYNNLIRVLTAHRKVILVRDPQLADAILYGSINTASYIPSATTPVSSLKPIGVGTNLPTSAFFVAFEYVATLDCSFVLRSSKKTFWNYSNSRTKTFPASNQLSVPGTTGGLINESEFDRALSSLARSMMDDVHESMLEMF